MTNNIQEEYSKEIHQVEEWSETTYKEIILIQMSIIGKPIILNLTQKYMEKKK